MRCSVLPCRLASALRKITTFVCQSEAFMIRTNNPGKITNPPGLLEQSKKKIAVVMGGYSSEHEISLKSGQTVLKHLPKDIYDVYPVIISLDGWYMERDNRKFPVDKNDFSVLLPEGRLTFDFVFNAIHGHPGEDGVLPAYWEMLGIPHSSSDFDKMALTFNKMYAISVVRAYGIPTAESVFLHQNDPVDTGAIIRKIGLPLFVKPNKAGSSYGISKVKTPEELLPAIEYAFTEDDEILIEEFLEGREFSVGVIKLNGTAEVFPITEIIPENEFFDFEAKYLGKAQEVTPARIPDDLRRRIETTARRVYEVLDLDGVSRAEYIVRNGKPYFLEINMVPGLTEASILPQQIRAAGKSLTQVFDEIIRTNLS